MTLLTEFTDIPTDLPGLPPDAVWHTEVVPNAAGLSLLALADATDRAYWRLLDRLLNPGPPLRLARIWNFIPAITTATDDGRNRYMAFNSGRYCALSAWYGIDGLAAHAPAATGVGAPGDDLVIHLLATPHAAVPRQNPKQTPAIGYSFRYGPKPPCFARATRVAGSLLVSGTAAIHGEDSVAPGDLSTQLDVTLDHLRTLAGDLSKYTALRAYIKHADDAAAVERRLRIAFGEMTRIDYAVTDLCRPELLVEIEGIARESEMP